MAETTLPAEPVANEGDKSTLKDTTVPPTPINGKPDTTIPTAPIDGEPDPVNADSTIPSAPPSKDHMQGDFVGNLKVNDTLPTEDEIKSCDDLFVLDRKGNSIPFKDLYRGQGSAPRQLIIFIRHFFCGNCQEYLRTLCSSISPDDLLALDPPTFITVIGCGQPDLIDFYVEATDCKFAVYADPTRKIYENFGMIRTLDLGKNKPEYMQSGVFGGALRSIVQGVMMGKGAVKGGDFKQVGGEFLFENGKPVWAHRMRNTRDHAEITEIRKVLGLDGTKPPLRKTWSSAAKAFARRSSSWGRPAKETSTDERKSVEKLRESPVVAPSNTNGMDGEKTADTLTGQKPTNTVAPAA